MYQTFNRDAVIADAYASPDIARAIGKMEPEHLRDEMRQELFVVLCALPEDKLEGLYRRGELRYFLVGTLLRMVKSDRSSFYNTFRKYNEEKAHGSIGITATGELARLICWGGELVFTDPDAISKDNRRRRIGGKGELSDALTATTDPTPEGLTEDDQVNLAHVMAQLDEYDASMLQLYKDFGNCRVIAQLTDIPERSVRLAVAAARDKAKKLIRACYT